MTEKFIPTVTEPCCEVWKMLAKRVFDWFGLDDNPEYLAMPFISDGYRDFRVNYCPSCGKYMREAVTKVDRL